MTGFFKRGCATVLETIQRTRPNPLGTQLCTYFLLMHTRMLYMHNRQCASHRSSIFDQPQPMHRPQSQGACKSSPCQRRVNALYTMTPPVSSIGELGCELIGGPADHVKR